MLLFVAAWSLRALHGFTLHHNHPERPICEASHDSSKPLHFHDHRYASDSCSICAFLLATPELLSVTVLLRKMTIHKAEQRHSFYKSPHIETVIDTAKLRGPPMA